MFDRVQNTQINQYIRDEIAKEIGYSDKIMQFVTEVRKFNQNSTNNTKKTTDRC